MTDMRDRAVNVLFGLMSFASALVMAVILKLPLFDVSIVCMLVLMGAAYIRRARM